MSKFEFKCGSYDCEDFACDSCMDCQYARYSVEFKKENKTIYFTYSPPEAVTFYKKNGEKCIFQPKKDSKKHKAFESWKRKFELVYYKQWQDEQNEEDEDEREFIRQAREWNLAHPIKRFTETHMKRIVNIIREDD